jgi:UDP-N-acetylglucosamine 2-epimerase (non-hydrolysing)
VKKKLLCVGGARPNFMKLAPLIRELDRDEDFETTLVHTGQHYDEQMSGAFFRDLNIPEPRHRLEVGSGSHAQQTAEIMRRIEPVMETERPGAVIVVGDVNSTLAAAIVAKKMGFPVVHVEAGLRSFDRAMPEEINRLVTDSITDLFLVTEKSGYEQLLKEGVARGSIHLVGNLMIDSLRGNLERAKNESTARKRLGLESSRYGLITLHRPANVDDAEQLAQIVEAVNRVAGSLPLCFPVHPRTRTRLSGLSHRLDGAIQLTEPLGYIDFVQVMAGAELVMTDSGGVQEETTALGIPCLTIRENTERPITIEEGTNRLAGTTTESILSAWEDHCRKPKTGRVPELWDGHAAGRCRQAIRKFFSLP